MFNRRLYHSWAGDKLCIDVNGHAEPGEDAERIGRDDLRGRWPDPAPALGERRRPRNLWFRADPGSATYVDDLDRAVGMALFPQDRPVMLWAGECGELMPNGRTGPHMRRLLQQNRHHRVTALFDGPRPIHVNPLVLAQSDFVAVYHLPNPNDRRRVAESIGYPARRFDVECEQTWRRGPVLVPAVARRGAQAVPDGAAARRRADRRADRGPRMTAAGEWLPESMRGGGCRCSTLRPGESCPVHPFDPTQYTPARGVCAWPTGCECAETCHGVDDPPAPSSLVAGAISRGLADSIAAGYRAQLNQLWAEVVAALPEDD